MTGPASGTPPPGSPWALPFSTTGSGRAITRLPSRSWPSTRTAGPPSRGRPTGTCGAGRPRRPPRGERELAIRDLSRAIALDKNVPAARQLRSQVYAELGQWDKAAADWAREAKSKPPGEWALEACARLLAGDTKGYQALCRELHR